MITLKLLPLLPLLAALACAARDESPALASVGKEVAPTAEIGIGTLPPRPEDANSQTPVHQAIEGSKYGIEIVFVGDSGPAGNHHRLRLIEVGGRGWDIGTLRSGDNSPKAVRADTTAVVFYRHGDYGYNSPIKLFLDPATKKTVKQIEFSSHAGLDSISRQDLAVALGVPSMVAAGLKGRDPRPGPEESWDMYLPQALKDHPMPSSTFAEFAQARPARVEDGYDSTGIGEGPGPIQIDGPRIWIGKAFDDGEGMSGVGDVGYFDTTTSTYTFLKIPELVNWSASTLLVEDETLWVGLVRHPEGADYGGGVLRRDLKSGATQTYGVDGVVHRIKRWNGRTYVATENGAAVIEDDRVAARYVVEPDINGKLILVRIDP